MKTSQEIADDRVHELAKALRSARKVLFKVAADDRLLEKMAVAAVEEIEKIDDLLRKTQGK